MGCPDDDELAMLLAAEAADEHALHEHIDGCPGCAAVLRELAALYHDDDDDDDELAAGSIIDERYRLEHALGRGGMGVVYLAHDERLRRPVALKLVRPAIAHDEPEHGEHLQARLHREAQAMARINDPAVVPVLDVGRYRGLVYVVMERVHGVTLRAWLHGRDRDRDRDAIVEALTTSARGLWAAHQAGVIHRDFKPDNVMVDEDGRARVTDFGMASLPDLVDQLPTGAGRTAEPASSSDVLTTRTGAVMGTPAYMAPEQLDGLAVTTMSDQYAWCVVVVEALCGQRPFGAQSLLGLREAQRGAPHPSLRELPPRLREIVARGLSEDPSARWPDLGAVLRRLEPPPRRWKRRLGWSAAAVAAMGLAAGSMLPSPATSATAVPTRCEAGATAVASAWSRALAERTESGREPARSLEPQLSGYVDVMVTAYRDQCATTPDTTAGPELDCLDLRAARLELILERWAQGTDDELREVVADLRDPRSCGSEDARPLPSEPLRADEARRLRLALEACRTHLELGDADLARQGLRDLRPEIEALGFGPVRAEHDLQLGRLLDGHGDYEGALATLEAAYWEAERAGDHRTAGRSATALSRVLGDTQERYDEADTWARHAEASLRRVEDPIAWFHYHQARATVAMRRQDPGPAREHAEQALALAQRLWPPEHHDVIAARSNLAVVDNLQGDFAAAEAELRRAIEAHEGLYGPDHPNLAVMLQALAESVSRQGRPQEAEPMLRRAIALSQGAYGPDHPSVFDAENGLAIVAAMQGDLAEAERRFRHNLEHVERRFGATDERATRLRVNLGNLQLEQGKLDAAAADLHHALRSLEDDLGPDGVGLAAPLVLLGQVEHGRGNDAAALEHLDRAIALVSGRDDVKPQLLAQARAARAEVTGDGPALSP
ncbi:MAG: serine/threonine-protein kinase [Nannocystaceae bacterium]